MTVNSIETVQELISEMKAEGTAIGSVWEYVNGMNNKKMFAVFAALQYCDIYDSPFVKNPEQIWANGEFRGKYTNLKEVKNDT